MTSTQASTPAARADRKIRIGVVVSNRMQKTISVRVPRTVRHPTYSRVIHRASVLKAHDDRNQAAIGDVVKIAETRPLSKDKRWRLVEIVRRASTAPPVPSDDEVVTPRAPEPASHSEGSSGVVG